MRRIASRTSCFRHALVAAQPASARAVGHRQIAMGGSIGPTRRLGARDALNASEGPERAAKMPHYARAAGRDALRSTSK